MTIEYLKSYNENKLNNKLEKNTPRGMSIAEIKALELEIYNGNKFPKAFREYLFIGGKWSCLSMNDGIYNKSNLYKKKLIKKGELILIGHLLYLIVKVGVVFYFYLFR